MVADPAGGSLVPLQCAAVIISAAHTCVSLPEGFYPEAAQMQKLPYKYPRSLASEEGNSKGCVLHRFSRVPRGKKSQLPTVGAAQ